MYTVRYIAYNEVVELTTNNRTQAKVWYAQCSANPNYYNVVVLWTIGGVTTDVTGLL